MKIQIKLYSNTWKSLASAYFEFKKKDSKNPIQILGIFYDSTGLIYPFK
jgi:hypothetical protein